ncbi:MAG: hypothetical protein AB1941_27520 [Gemmatimonadota bacterium]
MLRPPLVLFASEADRAAASDGRGTATATDAHGWEYLLHGGTWCCLTTGATRPLAEVQILPAEMRGQPGVAPRPLPRLAVSLAATGSPALAAGIAVVTLGVDTAREYAGAIAALRASGAPEGEAMAGPGVKLCPWPTDAEDPAYLVRGILEDGGVLDVGDELAGGTAVESRVVPTPGGIAIHLADPGTGAAARAWIPAMDIKRAAAAADASGFEWPAGSAPPA